MEKKRKKPAMVAQAFNPSIWKAERGPRTETTVGYMVRPHFQNIKRVIRVAQEV